MNDELHLFLMSLIDKVMWGSILLAFCLISSVIFLFDYVLFRYLFDYMSVRLLLLLFLFF